MPNRRPTVKGSFGGHFDELTKHFPHKEADRAKHDRDERKPKRRAKVSVHQALFERAAH